MVSGPASGAVGRLKKKKKMMTKSRWIKCIVRTKHATTSGSLLEANL